MADYIDTIRDLYPNPVAMDRTTDPDQCYCVGGAICLYTNTTSESGDVPTFPNEETLARALQSINDTLRARRAKDYAEDIINANDNGNFEDAWNIAREATEIEED